VCSNISQKQKKNRAKKKAKNKKKKNDEPKKKENSETAVVNDVGAAKEDSFPNVVDRGKKDKQENDLSGDISEK